VPPELYGGIERIVNLLVTGLQARGHTVGLVAHPHSTAQVSQFFPWREIRTERSARSLTQLNELRNTMALWSAVQQFQPDLLHSFSRLQYLLPLLVTGIPTIMSYQRRPTERTVRWASKLARHSLTFTGCSEHICQQGRRAGGVWHPIYNGVELERYTFQPAVSVDAPLVFLSRVERIKGAHRAIAIAQRTGRRLIIAGNHDTVGERGHYWQVEIAPHLGQNGIEYVGPVNDIQKNSLLGQAAALVVPIEWEEPFGIVFAEALACGTPVISCPKGALPEIIRQGIDGYLANSLEEACVAIHSLPKIDRYHCRQRAEAYFSAPTILNQYEQLYRSLLSAQRGRN
jgi:glycosyltransferase involved in cell wall biosynthesis